MAEAERERTAEVERDLRQAETQYQQDTTRLAAQSRAWQDSTVLARAETEAARVERDDALELEDVATSDFQEALEEIVVPVLEAHDPELAVHVMDLRGIELEARSTADDASSSLIAGLESQVRAGAELLNVRTKERDTARDRLADEQVLTAQLRVQVGVETDRGDKWERAASGWRIGTGATAAALVVLGVILIT